MQVQDPSCDIIEKISSLLLIPPSRQNSTYLMLSTASKFKIVFKDYKEREPHHDYAHVLEDWNKIDKVQTFRNV